MKKTAIDLTGTSFKTETEVGTIYAGHCFVTISFPDSPLTAWKRVSETKQWLQRKLPAVKWRPSKLERIIQSSGDDVLKMCLIATKLEAMGIRNADNG